MAGKRKEIDWEKGDKLIRLGQLSAAEIGRQLGCPTSTVTRRIKTKGITRDKSEEVKTRTRAALISKNLPQQRNATQREIAEVEEQDIDEAVNTNVALVLSHRNDIQKLATVEQKILAELGDEDSPPTKLYLANYKGQVIGKEVGLTVTEKSAALSNLASVQHRRIQLERQAFGLDGEEGGDADKQEINITNNVIERRIEPKEVAS